MRRRCTCVQAQHKRAGCGSPGQLSSRLSPQQHSLSAELAAVHARLCNQCTWSKAQHAGRRCTGGNWSPGQGWCRRAVVERHAVRCQLAYAITTRRAILWTCRHRQNQCPHSCCRRRLQASRRDENQTTPRWGPIPQIANYDVHVQARWVSSSTAAACQLPASRRNARCRWQARATAGTHAVGAPCFPCFDAARPTWTPAPKASCFRHPPPTESQQGQR